MALSPSSVKRAIDATGNSIKTFLFGTDDRHVQAVATVGPDGNPNAPSYDAFSRMRTGEPFGIFDNKNISTRNEAEWAEPIQGIIITYSGLAGTFSAAEEIRGALPAENIAIGTVVSDNGSNQMIVNADRNDFTVGDTITGQSSGATATVVTTGTGSDIQHEYNTSSVVLTAGTGATDKAIRQSYRYHAYVPGKSHIILMTFILGAAKANVVRRVGYFDDLNGLFLEQNGTTDVALVRRTSTSGAPVDNRYAQANWNIDTMDGAGPSGITLDLSKTQILVIDFQWLGVGRIRYGFDVDGSIIYVHQVLNANNLAVPYMKTPTLPVRYEISNTGVTASQSTMREVCSSVASEGGYALPGLEYTVDNSITPRAVTAQAPVLAIRLKSAYPAGQPNRRTIKFLNIGAFVDTNDAHIELHHVHDPYDVTATWTSAGPHSAVEYSTDISAYSGRPDHKIEAANIPVGIGNSPNTASITGEFIDFHSFASQNFGSTNSEMFVVTARAFTGTTNVYPHITWIEFE